MRTRPTILMLLIVALLAAGLPASSQALLANASQPWPPDRAGLLELPRGGPPPPPVSYMEPAGQLGGTTETIAVQGTVAYAGDGPRLLVLDVANPAEPVVLGETEPLPGVVFGVAVDGDRAYVAAAEAGLHIFDVTDPAAPVLLGAYETRSAAHMVAISGATAFVAASTNGLLVLDVSDPAQPQLLGSLDTPGAATGVVVDGDLAFVSDLGAGLRIVDVADPTQPVEIGFLDTPGFAWGLDVAGTTVYIADERGGLRMVDVSDPAQPVEVGAYTVPTLVVGAAVSGSIAYLADWWSGLRLVDVSDPANPVELGVFDTPGFAMEVAIAEAAGASPCCQRTAYVADGDGGLRIVDVTDPGSPAELGFHNTLGFASDLVADGSLVYVAGGHSGLRIVDASDPAQLQEVGWYPVPGGCVDVAVATEKAYLATIEEGLLIVDVTDPAHPAALGSLVLPNGARGLAVLGDRAYVVSETPWLRIVDVADPAQPVELGSFVIPGAARGVAVRGSVAYVAAGTAGLVMIDVSDPQHPVLLSTLDTPGDAWDVTVAGMLAFVADRDGGVRVIDVSNPWQPREYQPVRLPSVGVATGMMTPDGWPRLLYVARGGDGLAVVDHSLPGQPILAAYDTPGTGEAVTVVGATAYVADGAGGLHALRLMRDRQQATITPAGGSLAAADGSLIAIFPAGAFTETVTVTFERLATDDDTGRRLGIGYAFTLNAIAENGGQPAGLAPGKDYALVVHYTDADKGAAIEDSLRLYFHDGEGWIAEPSSQVHGYANALTALPRRLGRWSVLGETMRFYLPLLWVRNPQARPTPTATPCAQFSVSFSATPNVIAPGQESLLAWTVRCAQAAYLDGEPVPLQGSRRVQPRWTTTYVLRAIRWDARVQEERVTVIVRGATPTPTPTVFPTPSPTPFYAMRFAEDRTQALIDGQGCQIGNGCTVFRIQVANFGNRPEDYWLTKVEDLPPGWLSFFCWGNNCEYGNSPRRRVLAVDELEVVSLNFMLPPMLENGQIGTVAVTGNCGHCYNPVYEETFNLWIELPPIPTPVR